MKLSLKQMQKINEGARLARERVSKMSRSEKQQLEERARRRIQGISVNERDFGKPWPDYKPKRRSANP